MKAKLTIHERVCLLQLLPSEGNFLTLRMIQDLKRKVEFDAAELEHIEFNQLADKATWNPTKDTLLEREFLPSEVDIIAKALRKLDKEEKLNNNFLTLYTTFVKD